MLFRFFLLFVLVALVELLVLIEVGQLLGTIPTLALVLGTGILGGWLARRQGLTNLERVRNELSQGNLPAEPIVDGILILIAGILLITPGILTDLVGFLSLIPISRQWIRRLVWRMVERAVYDQRLQMRVHTPGSEADQHRTSHGRSRHPEEATRIYPVLTEYPSDEMNHRH